MIAILTGGASSERKVSLWSAETVKNALHQLGLAYTVIDCADKQWLMQLRQAKPKLAILALHGQFGEDGAIQAILEQEGIAYTGSDSKTASLTFNKQKTKEFVTKLGILSADTITHQAGNPLPLVRLPVVVKPNAEGSSFGVTLVWRSHDLSPALDVAHDFGQLALIEEYLVGTELTCAVTELFGPAAALPVVEIRPHTDFFDFAAKYQPGQCDEICPAEISLSLQKKVQDLSVKIFRQVGCRHYARIDWIVRDGKPYFLEINTLPGLTTNSLIIKELRAEGISIETFIQQLIKKACFNPA